MVKMCICIDSWDTIAACVSTLCTIAIVIFTCRQKRIQQANYQLCLFKECLRVVDPICTAYDYFDKDLDGFIRYYLAEDKEVECPIKGYIILDDLSATKTLFSALYPKSIAEFGRFVNDYKNVLQKARLMCNHLPKKPFDENTMTIHTFFHGRKTEGVITKKELSEAFTQAEDYIADYLNEKEVFIKQYSEFVKSIANTLKIG